MNFFKGVINALLIEVVIVLIVLSFIGVILILIRA